MQLEDRSSAPKLQGAAMEERGGLVWLEGLVVDGRAARLCGCLQRAGRARKVPAQHTDLRSMM